MILHVQFNCTYSCFILQKLGRHLFSGLEKFNYLQPQAINYLRQIENTRIFLLSLIKPLTLLHIKYLSSPLPSFNVVLKTTGFVQYGRASWPKQHCTYGDGKGGGGQFVHVSRCPVVALILENRQIYRKSFVRGCSLSSVMR